jgi:hypothetical protein
VVVGVTNEAEEKVKGWIQAKQAKYAIANVQGNETDQAYGVRGFPTSYLVGPGGDVLWTGHPASLDEKKIEEAVAKASFVAPVPAEFRAINAEIAKKNFGKAHGLIEKELAKKDDEALAGAKASIERLARERTAEAEAKGSTGDYAAAAGILEEISKQFKGMDEAEDAAKKLKEWKADRAIKVQIKAGEDFQKAEALEKTGDPAAKRKAHALYLQIAKEAKGTPIGEKAQAAADRLRAS